MAVIKKSGHMKYKDKAGNVYQLEPIIDTSGVTGLDDLINEMKVLDRPVAASSTNGVVYIATVPGITALTTGFSFIMIPDMISTSTSATLNVNNLGAKALRVRVSGYSGTTSAPMTANWLAPNKPVRVTYDGMWWIADVVLPSGDQLYGDVPAEDVSYTNTDSGLNATDVQAAIDELASSRPTDTTIQNHINNTTVHITTAERTAWNAKAEKSYVDSSIQSAIQSSWEASY